MLIDLEGNTLALCEHNNERHLPADFSLQLQDSIRNILCIPLRAWEVDLIHSCMHLVSFSYLASSMLIMTHNDLDANLSQKKIMACAFENRL